MRRVCSLLSSLAICCLCVGLAVGPTHAADDGADDQAQTPPGGPAGDQRAQRPWVTQTPPAEKPDYRFYAGVLLGGGEASDIPGVELDDTFVVGTSVGYDWGLVRTEVEYAYRNVDFPTDVVVFLPFCCFVRVEDDIDIHSFSGNLFVDIPITQRVGAFVGGGAGISLIENGFVDEDAFHYQVGGGLTLAMSHRISIDLGYRFFQTEELDIADRLTTHTGQLAVRFGF